MKKNTTTLVPFSVDHLLLNGFVRDFGQLGAATILELKARVAEGTVAEELEAYNGVNYRGIFRIWYLKDYLTSNQKSAKL